MEEASQFRDLYAVAVLHLTPPTSLHVTRPVLQLWWGMGLMGRKSCWVTLPARLHWGAGGRLGRLKGQGDGSSATLLAETPCALCNVWNWVRDHIPSAVTNGSGHFCHLHNLGFKSTKKIPEISKWNQPHKPIQYVQLSCYSLSGTHIPG